MGKIKRVRAWALCLGALLVASCSFAAAASASTPGVAGWGAGASGELGNGSTTANVSLFAPLSGAFTTNVVQVAAGSNFGLALRSNGVVLAWGSNSAGQLGVKGVSESKVPINVASLNKVIAISACDEQALALREGPEGNEVYYWGSGANGVPGASEPTLDTEITGAVAIAAGCEDRRVAENQATNLALLSNGHVVAWGNGEAGQLGNGESGKGVKSEKPVEVSGVTTATAIAAGGGQNLALVSGEKVLAWGENNSGQIGDGTTKDKATAVTLGLEHVKAIAAGDEDSLALIEGGTVKGWGDNGQGQIGSEGGSGSTTPINVAGLSNVTAISAGAHRGIDTTHNLALIEGGTVKAWGGNKDGELGNGTTGGFSATPVEVTNLKDTTSIAAGAQSSFAAGPPVPIITSIEPVTGEGGTKVVVHGYNLNEAIAAEFGSVPATAIEEDSETAVTIVAPAEKPRKVSVTVTTPFHTSGITSAANFLFTAPGSLEFGRCLSVGKKMGSYKKGCTELSEGGGFEWSTEIPKPGFTLSSAANAELVAAGGLLIVCTEVGSGSGEFTGGKSVTNVSIVLKGCGVAKIKTATKCNSPGAAAGEIRSSTLEGTVGFTSKEENKAALELLPAAEGGPFMQYTCGTTATEVRGEALAAMTPVNSSTTTFKLAFTQSKGKQKIEGFEGGPTEVLEASVGGGPFEQVGLADAVTLTGEEAAELNSVI
ncbi:MAG TPA: IPT/TIG domain-containing protein [Solirubrobacteraceae bacterium]|nr:IPT/TIG domain-containing protein [Solirubrobacteraceae bacterium]